MKRYKLLQRLLLENRVAKVGEIIKQGVGRYYYFEDGEFIKDKVVENNPEWFEEIKEIEVNLSYTPKSIYVSFSEAITGIEAEDIIKWIREFLNK